VLAAVATVGVVAGDSRLVQVSAKHFDRLAIQFAETINTVARANGQSADEFAGLIEAFEGHGDLHMDRIGNGPRITVASQHARGTPLQIDGGDSTISCHRAINLVRIQYNRATRQDARAWGFDCKWNSHDAATWMHNRILARPVPAARGPVSRVVRGLVQHDRVCAIRIEIRIAQRVPRARVPGLGPIGRSRGDWCFVRVARG